MDDRINVCLNERGDKPNQYWKISHICDDWYRLTCLGEGEGKSLDIRNDGTNTHVWLANTGNYSGQRWQFNKMGLI